VELVYQILLKTARYLVFGSNLRRFHHHAFRPRHHPIKPRHHAIQLCSHAFQFRQDAFQFLMRIGIMLERAGGLISNSRRCQRALASQSLVPDPQQPAPAGAIPPGHRSGLGPLGSGICKKFRCVKHMPSGSPLGQARDHMPRSSKLTPPDIVFIFFQILSRLSLRKFHLVVWPRFCPLGPAPEAKSNRASELPLDDGHTLALDADNSVINDEFPVF